jgi:hypothetical protein
MIFGELELPGKIVVARFRLWLGDCPPKKGEL